MEIYETDLSIRDQHECEDVKMILCNASNTFTE